MPSRPPSSSGSEANLTRALEKLNGTVRSMSAYYEYLIHPGKQLWLAFLKGVVSGLGVICAVAIVIPIVVTLLRGIKWVPLIGDFVNQIAEQVEDARRP